LLIPISRCSAFLPYAAY